MTLNSECHATKLAMTFIPYRPRFQTLLLVTAQVAVLYSAAALAQSLRDGRIACIPDSPVVTSGGAVHVGAYAVAPTGDHLQYMWTQSGGQISGAGPGTWPRITWNFKDTPSGIYTATVTVTSGGKRLGECSVQVAVVEPERGKVEAPAVRTSGRAFLVAGAKEDAGYGLYSYLLFGAPPTDSTRARYLKAIQAYLSLIQTITDLRTYRAANKLNITYLPVKVKPPDSPTVDWLLANYDFTRARILLDQLSPAYQTGPYFLSALTPLSGLPSTPHDHLFQDLSLVPTEPQDLVTWWVRAFLNQAAQEQFWQPQTGELLALKLRTMISVEAAALPEVQTQLASWLKWAK